MSAGEERVDVTLRAPEDVVVARHEARALAAGALFGKVEQERVEVIVAELATNAVRHAGGGRVAVEPLRRGERRGLRVVVSDRGPGIPDLERALQPGTSTSRSFGDGLATVRELADHLEIDSAAGRGTRVEVWRWAR